MIKMTAVLALALVAGCSSNTPTEVAWDVTGLAPLGDGFMYEGWLIVDGTPVSTGRFTVDDAGVASATTFAIAAGQDLATSFVVSIEPNPDTDPAPSATKILGGDFVSGVADLSVGHAAALGDDLTGALAPYILNTPSTGTDDTDFSQGIWWLDPGMGPGPSATLPALPAGWVYEGWIVDDSGPMSTGRFTSASGEDDDGAGVTAGPDGFPPFPGQDFIDPALDLVGLTAVISVEPEPDDSATPFSLKPLAGTIGAMDIGVLQDMTNQAATTNPTGTASFQ